MHNVEIKHNQRKYSCGLNWADLMTQIIMNILFFCSFSFTYI